MIDDLIYKLLELLGLIPKPIPVRIRNDRNK